MSKAVICDRCATAFSEQKATHIEEKWLFTTAHYDLCPTCRKAYYEFLNPVKKGEDDDGKVD